MRVDFLLAVLATSPFAVPLVAGLWPAPRSISTGPATRFLASDFAIEVCDGLHSLNSAESPNERRDAPYRKSTSSLGAPLSDAVERTMNHVRGDRVFPLVADFAPTETPASSQLSKLVLCKQPDRKGTCKSSDDNARSFSIYGQINSKMEDWDEYYELKVPDDGIASLNACTALGLLRGLQTFSQLVYSQNNMTKRNFESNFQVAWGNRYEVHANDHPQKSDDPSGQYISKVPLTIKDIPAFPIRGFMLDTARNFYTVNDLKKLIDAASWSKFNQFHWHAVDSQSWPLELISHPELSTNGAYSESQIYSDDDVSEIVSFANSRGIDVMVEFDTPGHTGIIYESHPSYVACNQEKDWASYAAEPPSGQLRLADDEVAEYTVSVFEALAKKFPSKYLSTGGDEVNIKCYDDDEETQSSLQAKGINLNQSLEQFVRKTHDSLRQNGKTPVVWDELAHEYDLGLGNDTVVVVWNSAQFVKDVVAKGFRVLHAASEYFYLDCGHGAWLGNATDLNSWCDPFKSWQRMYSFDPYANLTSGQHDLIVGGESLLWSEQTDSTNLQQNYWPRAAAVAEVFWTGAVLSDGSPRDVNEALPRMNDLRSRMLNRGIAAIPLQPQWCVHRPGQCDFAG